jgi:hypothetical protein
MEIKIMPLHAHLQERLDEAMHEIVGSLTVAYTGKTVSHKDNPDYRISVDEVTMWVYVDKFLHTTQKITFWEHDKEQQPAGLLTGSIMLESLGDLTNIIVHGS